MRKNCMALALAMAFPVSFTWADQTLTLPAVTITASPIIDGNFTDPFGSYSTSVSASQIQDLNAVDLASALRRTPGLTISRFNPVGAFGGEEGGAVYIRGMGSSRPGSEIKTYIDSVPFYMGVWNHPLLDLLPTHGMQGIDVFKGPQPHVFGNTFGAINLVPQGGAKKNGVEGDAQLSVGSFGTAVEQFSLRGRSGDLDYSLAQGYAKSSGHRDDSQGRLANFMGRVGYKLNPQWSVSALMLKTDNSASDPGHSSTMLGKGHQYDTSGELAALTVAHDYEWVKGEVKAYSNAGQAIQSPGFTTDFEMTGIRWREEIKTWVGGKMLAGLDVDHMSGTVSPIGFSSEKLSLTSPCVALSHTQNIGQGWGITPSAGMRGYDHNVLSDALAPHAALVLEQSDQVAIRLNASKGLSYPGIDAEVLSSLMPAMGSTWKSLQAEQMNHTELGVTWTPQPGTTLDALVFSDRVSSRYVFAFSPAVGFLNLGSYRVTGSEISLQHQLGLGWRLFAALSTLNSSKADLPYAPAKSLSLGANWQGGPWRVGMDALAQDKMFVLGQGRANGATNTDQVAGFAVANARVAYQVPTLGKRGEVFAAVENIFDKEYEMRAGYPMPGRSVQVGLHASF